MSTFTLDLVTPAREFFSREVQQVDIPGEAGIFGVLARHAPMIAALKPGIVEIYESTQAVSERIFISGGFAEVLGDRCTILAEEALFLGDIQRADVEARLTAAEKALDRAEGALEKLKAENELEVAKALLAAA